MGSACLVGQPKPDATKKKLNIHKEAIPAIFFTREEFLLGTMKSNFSGGRPTRKKGAFGAEPLSVAAASLVG
jgi:hypothetical protein